MKKKIIFFDFDGVIADSFNVAFEVNKIIDSSIATESDYRKLFDGNIADWAIRSIPKEEFERIDREFWKRYIPQMKKVKIFPGMKEIIMELAKKYTLLIISSTITSPIREFLRRNDIHAYFDNIVGNNFIDANKTERMKKVFKKYEADPKDCLFITDTLGDIREAASLGIQAIGVSWGFQAKENLLEGKPLSVAEKPGDLLNIVSGYFKKL